ncbi:hypothetical protein [Henriciella mobilis]|uniref:hypothetical protein n=1 Tax=Henriciella mobilis TaxID=2305467 RepID=UPI0011C3D7DD|nr:hypothetical protein [Henriciella mobilis]
MRLEYNLLSIAREDLPFADEAAETVSACLSESIRRCASRGGNPEKHPEVRFFRRAAETLSADVIQVLEIADFNTTGLTGPFDDPGSVFNSLVKADGDNNKQNADSGGSFGIGKNAAFAVSDLQTVLYSTLTEHEGVSAFACQARFQLISHERDGKPFSAEGYWGEANFYAITEPGGLPDWLVRSDRGTSIFAVGFRQDEQWAGRMALSIITNFLRAIMDGQMEFSIDSGRYRINRGTLAGYLKDSELEKIAEETGQRNALHRTRDIYSCFTSGVSETLTLPTGKTRGAQLRILVADDLEQPRSVLIVRNGMYITDNLRDFGDAFRTFSGTRPFVAVLEPGPDEDGRAFSEFLKRMENPEHDNFSAERLDDSREIREARAQVRKLAKTVREAIRSAAGVRESESTSLDELARYFQGDPQQAENAKANERDPERFRTGRARRTKARRPEPESTKGDTGGSGTSGGQSGGTGGGTGQGTGSGTGGAGTRGQAKEIAISGKRCRRQAPDAAFTHRIFFTPRASVTAAIRIDASGLTRPTRLTLANADKGRIARGLLVLDLVEGERQSVSLSFAEPYDGPVEFSSFSLEEGNAA